MIPLFAVRGRYVSAQQHFLPVTMMEKIEIKFPPIDLRRRKCHGWLILLGKHGETLFNYFDAYPVWVSYVVAEANRRENLIEAISSRQSAAPTGVPISFTNRRQPAGDSIRPLNRRVSGDV